MVIYQSQLINSVPPVKHKIIPVIPFYFYFTFAFCVFDYITYQKEIPLAFSYAQFFITINTQLAVSKGIILFIMYFL